MRLLLVEDDPTLRAQLCAGLQEAGHVVDAADNGRDGLHLGATGSYDAAILDLGLPQLDGISVLKRWREAGRTLPVLILTARDSWHEKVAGIDAGADDYLGKPFDLDELLARLRAVTRRSHGVPGAVLACRGVEIDLRDHRATRDGLPLWLTGREFTVLRLLMESAGKPVPRQRIEEQLGAWGGEVEGNSAEVYIHKLRKKLGRDFIQTLHGNGYLIPL